MSNVEKIIGELADTFPLGFDLSLARIKTLLAKLGNPQNNMPPTIHVAGTNGKGSTIAFCKSILAAAGFSVNVHTSPHLVHWRERYFLKNDYVQNTLLAKTIRHVTKKNNGDPCTLFEILTAVMFVLFAKYPADVCIIEVGLGGRFDATNIMPKTSIQVITPIGLDHQDWLGNTLAKIAFEKAGIMKKNSTVICGKQKKQAQTVLETQAKKMNCKFISANNHFKIKKFSNKFIWQNENVKYQLPLPALAGDHQIDNAATAISACLQLLRKMKKPMPSNEIIATAMNNVFWAGRLQKFPSKKLLSQLPKNSEIWLDGGHNPHAATALAKFLHQHIKTNKKKLVMISAMLHTKQPKNYFRQFANLPLKLYVVDGKNFNENFYNSQQLAAFAAQAGIAAIAKNNFRQAIKEISTHKNETCLIICGSLYFVGDILKNY